MRILILSKALVNGVYQRKLEELARLPDVELLAVVPPAWIESRVGVLQLERRFVEGYQLVVEPMWFNGHHHIHVYPGLAKHVARFRPDILHIHAGVGGKGKSGVIGLTFRRESFP